MKQLVRELKKIEAYQPDSIEAVRRVVSERLTRTRKYKGRISKEAIEVFSEWCATLTGFINGPLPVSIPQLNAVFAAIAWQDVSYIPRLDALQKVKGNYEEAFEAVLAAIEANLNGLVLPAKLDTPNWKQKFIAPATWKAMTELRKWAKKVPVLYKVSVSTNPPVQTEKPLNLGRWTFGMEGFRGHIAVVPQPGEPVVEVVASLPEGFVEETAVKALIYTATARCGWKKLP